MSNWKSLGEKIDNRNYRDGIRDALKGVVHSISIGRSSNCAGFSNSTPIEVVEGDAAPKLIGRPYLSTTFRRGSFTKNLYTPSTLRVVVGREWTPSR